MRWIKLHLAWLVCLFQGLHIGNSATATEEPKLPTPVYVGTYINRIFDVNLRESRFSADFYLWFRWQGDSIKPHETFQMVGGKVDEKTEVQRKQVGTTNYASVRLVSTISKYFDVVDFPLDEQHLKITIEEVIHDGQQMQYFLDGTNSSISPTLRFPGWTIVRPRCKAEVTNEIGRSTYGDPTLTEGSKTTRPRFRYEIVAARPGYGLFWKMFTGLFIATLLAFLGFFIRVNDVDPRFGLGIGAMFAAVGSQYITSSLLPDTHEIALADRLHILGFLTIFVTLALSTWSLSVYEAGREDESRRIDRTSFWSLFPIWILLNVLIVIFR